jgi:hypothetical protein
MSADQIACPAAVAQQGQPLVAADPPDVAIYYSVPVAISATTFPVKCSNVTVDLLVSR